MSKKNSNIQIECKQENELSFAYYFDNNVFIKKDKNLLEQISKKLKEATEYIDKYINCIN